MNGLVSHHTVEEGLDYYGAGCPWPGGDPEDRHYVKFLFDGANRLVLQVRYACVVVQSDAVEGITQSTLSLPEENVAQDLIAGVRENTLFVGLMFSVPAESEVHPYNQFGEIACWIETIAGEVLLGTPLEPQLAVERLPPTREFPYNMVIQYLPPQ